MRVVGALAVAALLVAAVPASAKPSIHLRGTAYAFNGPAVIKRASIRVAELPRVRATTRANGAYDLVVPDHARVTPYIIAPGYHTIYLQTFTTAGQNLRNVNFQTPTNDIYMALAGLLGVSLRELRGRLPAGPHREREPAVGPVRAPAPALAARVDQPGRRLALRAVRRGAAVGP